ncbi:hypothetical protein THRCLA_09758, partial [Thraustotheca clavata]
MNNSCVRSAWDKDGLDYLIYTLPLIAWGAFFVLTSTFVVYTHMWKEFKHNVDDLHDIPAQALGIVVARQTHRVLGKEISDPRRLLMLLSMWTELPGFSYLPLQLIYFEFNDHFAFAMDATTQAYKLVGFTSVLMFIALTYVIPLESLVVVRIKVLLPCLCDVMYLFYIYAIQDVITCASPLDKFAFPDGTTCACENRIWMAALFGTLLFSIFYVGTLIYKLRASDDIFANRFRYQTSFSSLMTITRTACCLQYIEAKSILTQNVSLKIPIFLVCSIFNLCMMSMLLHYNYRFQPCLGSGMFPNNLRSLSFMTSIWVTFLLFLITLVDNSLARQIFIGIAIALYPVVAGCLWYLNSKRARHFNIPNLPLLASLAHENYRVRTVAVVSIVLEEHSKWQRAELMRITHLLEACIKLPADAENGLLAAYTYQALWNLYSTHCTIEQSLQDGINKNCIPRGFWISHLPELPTTGNFQQSSFTTFSHNRLNDLVQRKATRSSASSSQLRRASCFASASLKTTRIANSAMQPMLQNAIYKAITVFDSSLSKARNVVAKTMQEMYINNAIRLSLQTWFDVVCTLCTNYNQDISASAALSLCHSSQHFEHDEWIPLLCKRENLTNLTYLVLHPGNIPIPQIRDVIVGNLLKRAASFVLHQATHQSP